MADWFSMLSHGKNVWAVGNSDSHHIRTSPVGYPRTCIRFGHDDPEKLSAYECGFNAFDDARMKFDVRFYLVAILFIIFDLEVAFLFPWAVAFGELGWYGFWSMMVFLGVLTVGFVYEWRKGALEWD